MNNATTSIAIIAPFSFANSLPLVDDDQLRPLTSDVLQVDTLQVLVDNYTRFDDSDLPAWSRFDDSDLPAWSSATGEEVD